MACDIIESINKIIFSSADSVNREVTEAEVEHFQDMTKLVVLPISNTNGPRLPTEPSSPDGREGIKVRKILFIISEGCWLSTKYIGSLGSEHVVRYCWEDFFFLINHHIVMHFELGYQSLKNALSCKTSGQNNGVMNDGQFLHINFFCRPSLPS